MQLHQCTRSTLRQHAVAPFSAAQPTCTIHLTIDTASVTGARRLAMRVCGEALEFMRIARDRQEGRMQVWLCVHAALAGAVTYALRQQLPGVLLTGARGQS